MTTTVPFGFTQTFPTFGQPVPFGGFVPGYTGTPVGATGFTAAAGTCTPSPTGQAWTPGTVPTADQAAGVQSFNAQPVTPFSTFPTSFFGYPTPTTTTPWSNWSPSFGYGPTSFGGTFGFTPTFGATGFGTPSFGATPSYFGGYTPSYGSPFGYTPSFAQGFFGQTPAPAFQPFSSYPTFGTPFSSFGTPFSTFGSTPWTSTASTPWSTFGSQSTPWSSYSPFTTPTSSFGSPFTSNYGGFQSPWAYSPYTASPFASTPWTSTPWSSTPWTSTPFGQTPWSFGSTPWTNSWTSTPWASTFSGFGTTPWNSFTQPFSSWTTPGAWAGYTGNTFASFPQTFPTVSPFASWPQNGFYTPSFFNWSAPFGYSQPVPFGATVDGTCDRGQRRGFGIREAA